MYQPCLPPPLAVTLARLNRILSAIPSQIASKICPRDDTTSGQLVGELENFGGREVVVYKGGYFRVCEGGKGSNEGWKGDDRQIDNSWLSYERSCILVVMARRRYGLFV